MMMCVYVRILSLAVASFSSVGSTLTSISVSYF